MPGRLIASVIGCKLLVMKTQSGWGSGDSISDMFDLDCPLNVLGEWEVLEARDSFVAAAPQVLDSWDSLYDSFFRFHESPLISAALGHLSIIN